MLKCATEKTNNAVIKKSNFFSYLRHPCIFWPEVTMMDMRWYNSTMLRTLEEYVSRIFSRCFKKSLFIFSEICFSIKFFEHCFIPIRFEPYQFAFKTQWAKILNRIFISNHENWKPSKKLYFYDFVGLSECISRD